MFKNFFIFCLDLLFPLECLRCSRPALFICNNCLDCIAVRDDVSRLPYVDQVLIACDYTPDIQKIIWSLKYANVSPAAEVLSKLLVRRLSGCILPADACLVPIPMPKKRQRQRGYNQAQLLANKLGDFYHLPVIPMIDRVSGNQRQAKLSRGERLKNIKNVFRPLSVAEDRLYILIDDVITTGSTVNEAAYSLRSAGAKHVWALAVTRNDQSIRFHSREKDLPVNRTQV